MSLAPSLALGSEPNSALMTQSGGSGGGSGQPPVPSVALSGGSSDGHGHYYASVGGAAAINIWTPIDEKIRSVTYTVQGAVQTQAWGLSAGQSPRLPSPLTHPANPATQQLNSTVDQLTFFWDETTGNHHIDVQVYYAQGAAASVAFDVSVEKPDVSSLSMTYNPLKFGKFTGGNNQQLIGFSQTDPGVYFNASITTHRFEGEFAFIQTISMDLMQKYSSTPTITETSPTVLDWNGLNQNDPLAIMIQDRSFNLFANETQNLPFTRPPYASPSVSLINDTPMLAFSGYSNNLNYPTMFREDVTFTTRLVFRPEGGIWISLGYMIWTLHGERTYLNNGLDRTDPANWAGSETLTPGTGGAGTAQIVPELLPAWTGNSQTYLQAWNNKKPL